MSLNGWEKTKLGTQEGCVACSAGPRSGFFLLSQGAGSVDGAAVAAGAPGRDSTEGPPPLYSTNQDFKFSYSEINFQDLSWSFRNLYKSMLEKSSSSQHGELVWGWARGHPQLGVRVVSICIKLLAVLGQKPGPSR